MRIAQIAPLTEAVPPQLYGVPNDIVLLRNRGQLFGWVNARNPQPARRPPGRSLTGGLDVSDDRLAALVHMNMFNPHELRAAVSQST
jgi:hypothetical protein